MHVLRGEIIRPDTDQPSGLERVRDGLVVIDQQGVLICSRAVAEIGGDMQLQLDRLGIRLESDEVVICGSSRVHPSSLVMKPPDLDMHSHTFQPPGVPGRLIEPGGWLEKTLEFETRVKRNPQLAHDCAKRLIMEWIMSGVAGGIQYTTSSVPAARAVLQVAKELGVEQFVRVGYVCMNQNVDGMNGNDKIRLEESTEENLTATRALLDEFPGQVVIIDRFPIAVNDELRRGLVALALEKGVLYEVHFDESDGEKDFNASLYDGLTIVQALDRCGVFQPGMRVGLAHALVSNCATIDFLHQKMEAGCQIDLRLCPSSNNHLSSYERKSGQVARMPLREYEAAGARLTLGLDKGAGRNLSIAAEALDERARPHWDGYVPSCIQLFRYATTNGLEALGFDAGRILREGERANLAVVAPDMLIQHPDELSDDLEALLGAVLEGAQRSHHVLQLYVDGREVKGPVVKVMEGRFR